MRNKKIQILLVFVLAIGLFGLLFYWRYGEKKQMESLNGLQETYKEYDKKIREIRNDMENKKAEVNDIEKPVFPKQKDIKKQPMFTCLQTKEYCY